HPPTTPTTHTNTTTAAQNNGRGQVRSNDAFPEFKLHLPQRRPAATLGMHPGVVDKNIEATDGLDAARTRFFRRGGVGHVGPNAHGLSPAAANLFYAFARVQEIGNHHGDAPGSQGCRNAVADASRTAGYQGHINDFGFRHESSSSGAAPKSWREMHCDLGLRSLPFPCRRIAIAFLTRNFCGTAQPFCAPEIWKELIEPKIRCQGVLKNLTCFIDC